MDRSETNLAAVRRSVAANPKTSICHRAQEVNIWTVTLNLNLNEDLHSYALKLQLSQQLLPSDHAQLREFTKWIIEQQKRNRNFADISHPQWKVSCSLWWHTNRHSYCIWVTNGCCYCLVGIVIWLPSHKTPGLCASIEIYCFWGQVVSARSTCHKAHETCTVLHKSYPGHVITHSWPELATTILGFNTYELFLEEFFEVSGLLQQAYSEEQNWTICQRKSAICANFARTLRVCPQSLGGHLFDMCFYTFFQNVFIIIIIIINEYFSYLLQRAMFYSKFKSHCKTFYLLKRTFFSSTFILVLLDMAKAINGINCE